MVLAVWTTTARHGEPCMSARGTAKDESPEFVPLDEGDAALFSAGGQDENALSICPLCSSQGGERICFSCPEWFLNRFFFFYSVPACLPISLGRSSQ